MSKSGSKRKDIEAKIASLRDEARKVRMHLSAIEDQIADYVGDLQMLQVNSKDDC